MENKIFYKRKIIVDKLLTYGFKRKDNNYIYTKNILNDSLQVQVIYTKTNDILKVKVIDNEFNEEYTSFRRKEKGEFSSQVVTEIEKILIDIKNKVTKENYFLYQQSNRITDYIKKEYQIEPEFLWKNDNKNAVFRNKNNQKWFGIIMNINRYKLDNISEDIEVINVKLNPEKIILLLKKTGYYPAYHMNKKYWITIVLNETIKDQQIKELIKESYSYTIKK